MSLFDKDRNVFDSGATNELKSLFPFAEWEYDSYKYVGVSFIHQPQGDMQSNMVDFVKKMLPIETKMMEQYVQPGQDATLKDERLLNSTGITVFRGAHGGLQCRL